MKKVCISVIIPAYNVEKYLSKTIESIMSQTFKDLELIIMNDGSTDGTDTIIKKYMRKYPQCIFGYCQENEGQSSARNNSLKYVNGDYLTFVDADDILLPDYLERLYASSKENNADISMCGYSFFNDETGDILYVRSPLEWKVSFSNEISHVFHYTPCGKLFKTSFIFQHDFRFSVGEQLEDGPYSVMTDLLANKVIVLDYNGYYYRKRTDSTTGVLRKYYEKPKVPYRGIEMAINKVRDYDSEGKKEEVLEYCIIKILTGLLTNMYKNIDNESRKEICNYCYKTIDNYFPNILDNKYFKIYKIKKLPLIHRIAIRLFLFSYKHKMLYPFSLLVSKIL